MLDTPPRQGSFRSSSLSAGVVSCDIELVADIVPQTMSSPDTPRNEQRVLFSLYVTVPVFVSHVDLGMPDVPTSRLRPLLVRHVLKWTQAPGPMTLRSGRPRCFSKGSYVRCPTPMVHCLTRDTTATTACTPLRLVESPVRDFLVCIDTWCTDEASPRQPREAWRRRLARGISRGLVAAAPGSTAASGEQLPSLSDPPLHGLGPSMRVPKSYIEDRMCKWVLSTSTPF